MIRSHKHEEPVTNDNLKPAFVIPRGLSSRAIEIYVLFCYKLLLLHTKFIRLFQLQV
jgi:hypothetical protein